MRFPLRPIRNIFQVASLILVLVVVALVSAVTTMHFAIHGAEVSIPALKGMTVAEARSQAAGLGLNLEVDNRYYSSDVAAGHILTQSPEAGVIVRREWRVRVAESLGPQKVEIPSVLGLSERAAALNLRRVGLEVGATAHLPAHLVGSDAVPGTVLAQDPPAKAKGVEQPSVNLLLADAAEQDADSGGLVMAQLVGLPIVSAQNAILRAGLKAAQPIFADQPIADVGSGQQAPRAPIAPGTVVGQQPPAGYRIDRSTSIELTVAK